MKERPILFSGEMVKAILEGRKTQTRRIVKRQPALGNTLKIRFDEACEFGSNIEMKTQFQKCPFGKPGDLLWVRETFAYYPDENHFIYREREGEDLLALDAPVDLKGCWKPSIHMPRRASRITLEITDVRVERIQDISPQDAEAEGFGWSYEKFPKDEPNCTDRETSPFGNFLKCWKSIYPGSWERNDFCWVIEFKKVEDKL